MDASTRAVKAYYDEHRTDRFDAPESVRARHILIKLEPGADEKARAATRKKAEDALARFDLAVVRIRTSPAEPPLAWLSQSLR